MNQPYTPPTEEHGKDHGKIMCILSLVFGILSIILSCIPIIVIPVALTGLALGILGRTRNQHASGYFTGIATAGIVVSLVGAVFTLVFHFFLITIFIFSWF